MIVGNPKPLGEIIAAVPDIKTVLVLGCGTCGGSCDGKCEISRMVGRDIECAWQWMIDRLNELDKMSYYEKIEPPKDWSTGTAQGPRRLTHPQNSHTSSQPSITALPPVNTS